MGTSTNNMVRYYGIIYKDATAGEIELPNKEPPAYLYTRGKHGRNIYLTFIEELAIYVEDESVNPQYKGDVWVH